MKIFVVAGKAGSGKGEVAKIINEYYIYKIKKSVVTSYSKYLKMFARELTDWDGNENTKPRDFLQQFGSKIREYNQDYFINRMIEDVEIYKLDGVDNIIIGDARMPEEVEKIQNIYDNVYSIYVVNQFAPSKLTIEQQSHITETAFENYNGFDYVVANDKLDVLKEKIFKILEEIDNNGEQS